VQRGDSVKVSGKLTQFNGLTEIDSALVVTSISTAAPQPQPLALSLAQIDATFQSSHCEPNESRLVRVPFGLIRKATGAMPAPSDTFSRGTNYRLMSAGYDSLTHFVNLSVLTSRGCNDPNTLLGQPIPYACTVSVTGVLSQFVTTPPYTTGYELLARWAGDVVSCQTVDAGSQSIAFLRFRLLPPRENPSRSGTTILFELPAPRAVTAKVFDIRGRLIRTLANDRPLPVGLQSLQWDGRGVLANPVQGGIYFVRVWAGSESETQRIILLR